MGLEKFRVAWKRFEIFTLIDNREKITIAKIKNVKQWVALNTTLFFIQTWHSYITKYREAKIPELEEPHRLYFNYQMFNSYCKRV